MPLPVSVFVQIIKHSAGGENVAVIKSSRDHRYAAHWVVTHGGQCVQCFTVERLSHFREQIREEEWASYDVVASDEAQFFDDLVEFAER